MRRRRAVAALVAVGVLMLLGVLVTSGGGHKPSPVLPKVSRRARLARAPFAVREFDVAYTDTSRVMSLRDGTTAPRQLRTRILYPVAPAGQRAPAPFPLVVFGHGYALTPQTYWPLLGAWARAGYVVAAPVFPLENGAAPGGPNEADLSNQPGDISFVISRLLAHSADPHDPLHGLVNPSEIAVAGHSDGGDSALAVAEGSNRDHRVSAAVILAGAQLPGAGLDSSGPPLLAVQGTADPINSPSATDTYFAAVAAPKFLVSLLGARHIPPYSSQQPQLGVVERVTLAFLDRYLRGDQSAAATLTKAASVPGIAQLSTGS